MSKGRKSRFFACDFETTVYEGQVYTEVWAAACVEFGSEDVKVFHSIGDQFLYFQRLNANVIAYYHNLKFDGEFWLSYLLRELKYKQSARKKSDGTDHWAPEDLANDFEWIDRSDMKNRTFEYSISDMGQWYRIIIKTNTGKIIEIRDSLKLLPFSVKAIGDGFKTKHKKLDMEYTGFRYAGCEITPEERQYIANDVLVVKEALEILYEEGHKKLTIGACALADFKKTISRSAWADYMPDLYQYELTPEECAAYGLRPRYGRPNPTIGDYIRKSYRGGWCYLVRGRENRLAHNGTTADVNSLYPSMMHSESGNKYPVGLPTFWRGNLIPAEALAYDKYYFVRFRTRFYLKEGHLPFVQIKGNFLYRGNECLESSDVFNPKDGKYYDHYKTIEGDQRPAGVVLTMTCTDFVLFREHYNLVDFEILDGCYFDAVIGLFDEYIDKYRTMKQTSKGARRQLAKLMLNSLYGKTAASTDSSFKVAFLREDKSIGFWTVERFDKTPGYIPIGSAITSYARNFTIRAAQQNFHGPDKPGFIYADTDSIHCDLPPDQLKGIRVDPTAFCCWKLESSWDDALFVRQKTYMEHITAEDLQPVEEPYWSIKCAGLPQRSKDLFLLSMEGYKHDRDSDFSEAELEFLETKREVTDFSSGLKIPGKLIPRHIPGGVVLEENYYEIR